MQAAGFWIVAWNDVTRESTDWFRGALEKAVKHGLSSLNPGILMGPEFSMKATNVLRSLEEDRLRVVQAVFTLPPLTEGG